MDQKGTQSRKTAARLLMAGGSLFTIRGVTWSEHSSIKIPSARAAISQHPHLPLLSAKRAPLCEHRHVGSNCKQLKSNPDPDAGLKRGRAGLMKNNNNRTTTTKNPISQVENADRMEKGIGGEGWGQPEPSAGPGASHTFLQRQ